MYCPTRLLPEVTSNQLLAPPSNHGAPFSSGFVASLDQPAFSPKILDPPLNAGYCMPVTCRCCAGNYFLGKVASLVCVAYNYIVDRFNKVRFVSWCCYFTLRVYVQFYTPVQSTDHGDWWSVSGQALCPGSPHGDTTAGRSQVVPARALCPGSPHVDTTAARSQVVPARALSPGSSPR